MKINWCKIFGHKWERVYIGKRGEWKMITTYCSRCDFGRLNIYDFLYTHKHDYGTYTEKYFKENGG
jgi:hypothetical protein